MKLSKEIENIRDELADKYREITKCDSLGYMTYKCAFDACAEIFLKREADFQLQYKAREEYWAGDNRTIMRACNKLQAELSVAIEALSASHARAANKEWVRSTIEEALAKLKESK